MRVLVLALCAALLAACSAPQSSSAGCSQESVALESVEIGLRVVSIANGAGAIVSALGAKSALVGSDLASDVGVEVINPAHQVDVEKLLSLKPDVVFVGSDEPDQVALDAIATLDAKVVMLDPPTSFEDSMQQIEVIANQLGLDDRGTELSGQIRASIDSLDLSRVSGATVAFLYLRGNAGVFLISGSNSGADDLIKMLGAKDVGVELGISGFAPISPEALAKASPDFIIVMEKGLESVGGVEGLMRLPGIAGTKAAQNAGILSAKDSELLSFGPATPKVLACLIEQVQ